MIDREKLKEKVNKSRILCLARIQKISELAGLLDKIDYAIEFGKSDLFIEHLVKMETYYADTLDQLDTDWIKANKKTFEEMNEICKQQHSED